MNELQPKFFDIQKCPQLIEKKDIVFNDFLGLSDDLSVKSISKQESLNLRLNMIKSNNNQDYDVKNVMSYFFDLNESKSTLNTQQDQNYQSNKNKKLSYLIEKNIKKCSYKQNEQEKQINKISVNIQKKQGPSLIRLHTLSIQQKVQNLKDLTKQYTYSFKPKINKFANLPNRSVSLYDDAQKRKQTLQIMIQEKLKIDIKNPDLTFKPKINKNYIKNQFQQRQIKTILLFSRQEQFIYQKQEHLKQINHDVSDERNHQFKRICTFKPNIKPLKMKQQSLTEYQIKGIFQHFQRLEKHKSQNKIQQSLNEKHGVLLFKQQSCILDKKINEQKLKNNIYKKQENQYIQQFQQPYIKFCDNKIFFQNDDQITAQLYK